MSISDAWRGLSFGRRRAGSVAWAALLAAALSIWFLRRVDLASVAAELARARAGWVVLAALLQSAALAARGARWRSLLAARQPVPLAAAVEATFAGWVPLAVLPARVGELARPFLLARRVAVDRSFALGALMLERLLDVLCLLALLAVYLAAGAPHSESHAGDLLAGDLGRLQATMLVLVLGAIAALVAVVAAAPALERALERRRGDERPLARRWLERARSFADGATGIRSFRAAAVVIVQSAALWGLVGSAHAALFRALDLDLTPLAIPALLVFIVLGALVPTPVAIGSYHAAVQIALGSLFGLPLAAATAYALVSHATAYLPNLAVGSVLLVRMVPPLRTPDGSAL